MMVAGCRRRGDTHEAAEPRKRQRPAGNQHLPLVRVVSGGGVNVVQLVGVKRYAALLPWREVRLEVVLLSSQGRGEEGAGDAGCRQ